MTTFEECVRARERSPRVTGSVVFPTGVTVALGAGDVIGFSVNEGVSDGLLLGAAIGAHCEVTLAGAGGAWLIGGAKRGQNPLIGARVELCLSFDGTDESRPLCAFTVRTARLMENDARVLLSGGDALSDALDAPFVDGQTYPCTLAQIAAYIAARAEMDINADFPNASVVVGQTPDWGDVSLRGALSHVACAAASFARVGRDGALTISPVHDTAEPFALPAVNTLSRAYGEIAFGPLTALVVTPSGERGAPNISLGAPATDGNSLKIMDNPLFAYGAAHTQTLADGVFEALSGLTLTSFQATWQGDPSLTIGRRVRVTDHRGVTTTTTVTRQRLLFDQGFSMTSECTLRSAFEGGAGLLISRRGFLNAARLTGDLDGSLLRAGTVAVDSLVAGSVTASRIASGAIGTEHLAACSVTAGKLSADSVTADNAALADAAVTYAKIATAAVRSLSADALNAISAHIVDLAAGTVEANALYAALARIAQTEIGNADIGFAQIKDLVAGTAIITEGAGGKLYISRLAVSEANIVSLTAGELVVKGADGRFYALGVDGNGEVTTTEKAVGNDNIADRTVSAGKLVEHSITAEELNVSQIFADSALIRAIKAANIDTADLFANNAFVGELTTSVINSGVGASLDLSSNQAITAIVSGLHAASAHVVVTAGKVVFDAGTESITLTARVYEGETEVTDGIEETAFVWSRTSGNADADAEWNALWKTGKTLTLTRADVDRYATYNCNVDYTPTGTLPDGIYLTDEHGNVLTDGAGALLIA